MSALPPKFVSGLAVFGWLVSLTVGMSGQQRPNPLSLPHQGAPAVEKLADGSLRVGTLRVDTAKREVVAVGTINDVTILEWVANTRGGAKAYESLMTIDTDAITFNAALLLIGLDPSRARVPSYHFDPEPPRGDPLDIFVDVKTPSPRRVRIEELLFDQRTSTTMVEGPWVYTGSTFVESPTDRRYLADLDGVLIGFVHSPSPVIENPRAGATNAYGSVVLNPKLGLTAGSSVTLTIKALTRPSAR